METIDVSTFKAACLALLKKVRITGQPILVIERGEPLAVVMPPPPEEKPASWLGAMAGTGGITGDIVEPVAPEEQWEALGDESASSGGHHAPQG